MTVTHRLSFIKTSNGGLMRKITLCFLMIFALSITAVSVYAQDDKTNLLLESITPTMIAFLHSNSFIFVLSSPVP